jgi:diguanylate cyclase (GGDEF)-like protein
LLNGLVWSPDRVKRVPIRRIVRPTQVITTYVIQRRHYAGSQGAERVGGLWGWCVSPAGNGGSWVSVARRIYAATVAVLAVGYCLVNDARAAIVAAVTVVSVAAVVVVTPRQRREQRVAWLLIAGGNALLGVGVLILLFGPHPEPWPAVSPGVADVFYLLAYLPLAVGLLRLGQSARPTRDTPMIIDAVAWCLAGSLVVWITLARPRVVGAHLSPAGKAALLAEGVAYVAVFAVSARILWTRPANLARWLLAAGTILFVASDFVYGAAFLHLHQHLVGLAGLGYFCFSALCGAAALIPSTTTVESPAHLHRQLGTGRLAVLATALAAAPSALFVEATSGPVTAGVAIAVVSTAVGGLVLARLFLSARDNRLRTRCNDALKGASRALVMATTESEVIAAAAAAFATVLPTEPTNVRISLSAVPHPRTEVCVGAGGAGQLRVPIGAADEDSSASDVGRRSSELTGQAMVFNASVAQLVQLRPFLCYLAEQAGVALNRIDLVARLRSEERQHYFRTLVLASTDVTLISRDDRVDFATPSAQSMFGRDVRGRSFDQLVSRHGSDGDPMPPGESAWSDVENGADGQILRPDGRAVVVLVRRRDLSEDPSVIGIVSTLRDVTTERTLQHDLAYRASHDALTGLSNAQCFNDALRDLPSTATGPEGGSDRGRAALFVDLDDFKIVNDTYGHDVGDALLSIVARRIEACLGAHDLAARLGGDEFAVLLTDLASVDRAREVAERIATTLAHPAEVAGVSLNCQASIGVAYADGEQRADTILADADAALYTAKAQGKGRWLQFHDRADASKRASVDIGHRLDVANDVDRFNLRYDPVVELESGRVAGFQAVLHDPTSGEPDATSQRPVVAGGVDQSTEAADRLLGRAVIDAAALNAASPAEEEIFICVNISAGQLRDHRFVDSVRDHLAASGLAPQLLVLGIKEFLSLDDDEGAWSFLHELRRDGVRVAIDDFGAGYASLNYLRQPGLDIVKTDPSFLRDLPTPRNRALLQAVIWLSAQLGLTHIAEGVHDTTTRDLLLGLGCRLGQGSQYALPMPIDEAIEWQRRPWNQVAIGGG